MPTQKQIAEHLDLSQVEVSKLVAELGISWKTAELSAIRVPYIRKLRAVAAGHKSHAGLDLTQERALTEQVDREIKLYDLAERKGRVVNLAQLEPELRQMVGAFKTEVAGLADKIKGEIDALHGIDVDIVLLEEHIHATFAQLARYDPERAGTGAPAGDADGAGGQDEHDDVGAKQPPAVGQVDGEAGSVQPGHHAVGGGHS